MNATDSAKETLPAKRLLSGKNKYVEPHLTNLVCIYVCQTRNKTSLFRQTHLEKSRPKNNNSNTF
jgi:hypothetical protein